LFKKAIELEPGLARAYVGLAYTYTVMMDSGFAPSMPEALDKQMAAAQKALALDPNDGESHLALGMAHAWRGELDKAAPEFDRAEALAPNNADVLLLISWYLPTMGQTDRALELVNRATRLNPNYPDWYIPGLRYVYFFGRQFDKAFNAAKSVEQQGLGDYVYLALIDAKLGRDTDAKAAAAKVLRLEPDWTAERWISDQGGFAREQESNLVLESAGMAGLPVCATEPTVDKQPNLIRLKACDQQRAKKATG
jgi:tetratricopeptide (TPR) repeat protein